MNKMLVIIKKKAEWPKDKEDPAEFCEEGYVFVREDYDYENDPDGWIIHEKCHYNLSKMEDKELYNYMKKGTYPANMVEQFAYTAQFRYLIRKGKVKTVDDLKKLFPWKFKNSFVSAILETYFLDALLLETVIN